MAFPWHHLLSESVTIAGWVALWKPIEMFLYDLPEMRRRAEEGAGGGGRPPHGSPLGFRGGVRHECRGGRAQRSRPARPSPRGTALVSLAAMVRRQADRPGLAAAALGHLACGGRASRAEWWRGWQWRRRSGGRRWRIHGRCLAGSNAGVRVGLRQRLRDRTRSVGPRLRRTEHGSVRPAPSPLLIALGPATVPQAAAVPCTDGATGGHLLASSARAAAWLCPGGTHPVIPVVDAGAADARSDSTAPGHLPSRSIVLLPRHARRALRLFPWCPSVPNGAWTCCDGTDPGDALPLLRSSRRLRLRRRWHHCLDAGTD